jgi:hypothetical protein
MNPTRFIVYRRNGTYYCEDTVQLPRTFGQLFSGLNGAKQLLLQQIDRQSSEFAIAQATVGGAKG